MPKALPKPRQRLETEHVRERILEAFSQKAKRQGIRGVVMGELASELRMSMSTLYKQFPSKQELTLASVERWASELAASEAARPKRSAKKAGFDRFMHWGEAWADAMGSLSPAFIEDLKRDHPAANARFQQEMRRRQRDGAALLRPLLKTDLDEGVALEVLLMIMTRVTATDFADRLGVTRRESIRTALSVWASGALRSEGALLKLPGGKGK